MKDSDLIAKYVISRSRAGIFSVLKRLCRQTVISELSQKGISRPEKCQFPAAIPVNGQYNTAVGYLSPFSEGSENNNCAFGYDDNDKRK